MKMRLNFVEVLHSCCEIKIDNPKIAKDSGLVLREVSAADRIPRPKERAFTRKNCAAQIALLVSPSAGNTQGKALVTGARRHSFFIFCCATGVVRSPSKKRLQQRKEVLQVVVIFSDQCESVT